MLTAGLDIGSRTIALVEWDGEQVMRAEVIDTGPDPLTRSRQLIEGRIYDQNDRHGLWAAPRRRTRTGRPSHH